MRVPTLALVLAVGFGGALLTARTVEAQAGDGGMSAEDSRFADALIRDLGYFDTARRWLGELKSSRGAKPALQAEVDSRLIDILQAEGKRAEADRALEQFKKTYPWHPRASLGSLELIGTKLSEVLALFEEAAKSPDEKKTAELRATAKRRFVAEVEKPLEELVKSLDEQAKADEKDYGKLRLAYQAALAQVRIYRIFANALGPDAKEREELLERGKRLAESFVDERYEFYMMTYDAQIEKGQYLSDLGEHETAAEEISLILEVVPPGRPPYPPELIKAFQLRKLQAALFTARAYNAAKSFDKAVAVLRANVFRKPSNALEVDIDAAESDGDLRQYAILTRLEYGIALAGAGDAQAGMEVIHGIIDRYGSAEDDALRAFAVDARKALGRIASGGSVALSGRDYYQAGIGLKAQLKWEEALTAFQQALGKLEPTDLREVAPLVLNEIGEICYILERFDESAVAFDELTRYYEGSDNYQKAATSFLGAVTRAQGQLGARSTSHVGFNELARTAETVQARFGDNSLALVQRLFNEAGRYEQQRSWEEARRAYAKVPEKNRDGSVQPEYYRARASAIATYVREWQATQGEAEKAALAAKFEEAIPELRELVEKAMPYAESSTGAALAALTLGEALYHSKQPDEAAEALKVFTTTLKEDKTYRCPALGYLILALIGAQKGAEADGLFSELRDACGDDATVASVSFALSESASGRGEDKRAAAYMLVFVGHPSVQDELDNLPMVMEIVKVLVDGGAFVDARKYIEVAKGLPAEDAADLERQLAFLDGRIAYASKDWSGAIETLNAYAERFGATGANSEDSDVALMLGEATINRAKAAKKITVATLQQAKTYYGHAVRLLEARVLDPTSPAPTKVLRDYWLCAYRYLQCMDGLGRRGDQDAYREVHIFCNERRHRILDSRYRSNFVKLWKRALTELGQNPDEVIGGGSK